jgi:hypothetical protein
MPMVFQVVHAKAEAFDWVMFKQLPQRSPAASSALG